MASADRSNSCSSHGSSRSGRSISSNSLPSQPICGFDFASLPVFQSLGLVVGTSCYSPETKRSSQAKSENSSSRTKPNLSRASFIKHGEGALQESFEIVSQAGEGSQGVVFVARRKGDGASRAVKRVLKASMWGEDKRAFHKDMEIMRTMDHPHIVKLYDTFEDRRAYFLVMELCEGGELLDRVIKQGHLTERQAAVVVQQVLRAVFYVHESGYAHRDLKPENFLLARDGPISEDNPLKLIDFGIACECGPTQKLTALCGTPFYVAPQVVTKRYDKRCDLWSVGVIMYTLLSGRIPFDGTDQEILSQARAGVVDYPKRHWASVSDDAKSLVKGLLTRSANGRISAEDALQHPWIRDLASTAAKALPETLVTNLLAFSRANVVKKVALQIVVGEMGDSEVGDLRKVFTSLDHNGDGKLTIAEMLDGLKTARIEVPDYFEEAFASIDADGSGLVDYTEFLAAALDRRRSLPEAACRQAFEKFDTDRVGRIRAEDIVEALAGGDARLERAFERQASAVVSKYGSVEEGTLGFSEFQEMLRSCSGQMRSCSGRLASEPSGLLTQAYSGRLLPDCGSSSDGSADS